MIIYTHQYVYRQQNKRCINSITMTCYYINFSMVDTTLWWCMNMVVRIRNIFLRYIIPPLHVSQQSATGWYATRVYSWWPAVGLPGYSSRRCYHWRNVRGQRVACRWLQQDDRWCCDQHPASGSLWACCVWTGFASIETTQHAWRGLFEQIKRLSCVLSTCSMFNVGTDLAIVSTRETVEYLIEHVEQHVQALS